MPVEVIGGEVQQHRRLGRERERVLELERGDLADDRCARRRRRVRSLCEPAQREPDVSRDPNREVRLAVKMADQLHGGRLAVRPRHGDDLVRDHPPRELELAEDRQATLACGSHERCIRRHSGALDERPRTLEHVRAFVAQMHPHACARERVGPGGTAGVNAEDLLVARTERERRGRPGAGEPDHHIRPVGKSRTRLHRTLWRKTTKPIAPNSAAMIQKRRMIFVSDQSRSSK